MTLEEFCDRLEALPPEYRFTLQFGRQFRFERYRTLGNNLLPNSAIKDYFCPLTAVCLNATEVEETLDGYFNAGLLLKIEGPTIMAITYGADYLPHELDGYNDYSHPGIIKARTQMEEALRRREERLNGPKVV